MTSDCRADGEGRIKMATVSAPDLDAVVKSYQDFFAYAVVENGTVDADLAAAWGAPAMAGWRYAVTGPESGTEVYIRVVENDAVAEYTPLRSFGWAALELTVTDVEALDARLRDSPFEIIGPPAFLDFSDKIYPMQAVGLAGEPFYLNEVRGSLPDYDLPLARAFVDHIFITILATPDMQRAVDFYTTNLGWAQGNEYDVPYSVINQAFGLHEDTPHKLSMTCVGRDVNNEIDQYPAETVVRPRKDGMLVPGVASVSFITESLGACRAPFLSPPTTPAGVPYNGRRMACTIGAAGELIELIEA